jgi:hypothetical protein
MISESVLARRRAREGLGGATRFERNALREKRALGERGIAMTTMRARPIRHAFAAVGAICLCQIPALGPALAQSAAQIAEMESRFAAADKDGDGKLTPEEAKAGMPRVSKNFAKIDKGAKGFVTVEDIKDAMALMAGR